MVTDVGSAVYARPPKEVTDRFPSQGKGFKKTASRRMVQAPKRRHKLGLRAWRGLALAATLQTSRLRDLSVLIPGLRGKLPPSGLGLADAAARTYRTSRMLLHPPPDATVPCPPGLRAHTHVLGSG